MRGEGRGGPDRAGEPGAGRAGPVDTHRAGGMEHEGQERGTLSSVHSVCGTLGNEVAEMATQDPTLTGPTCEQGVPSSVQRADSGVCILPCRFLWPLW